MDFYVSNINKDTVENDYYRKVLFTGPNEQLVVMCLEPGEDIGEEVHSNTDQFIRIEQGEGKAVLNGSEYELKDDFALIVPAGTTHNIINTSENKKLKLYTVYSPPEHKDGTIHKTKKEDIGEHH